MAGSKGVSLGKGTKLGRSATTIDRASKDRSKAKRDPKAKYKKRKGKR